MEWQWNVEPNEPPNLGIAVSGGGMRSAIFSLGVLTGLHRDGLFPQETDILSAVSGGGYIAAWFYGQQALSYRSTDGQYSLSPDSLLNRDGPAQQRLSKRTGMVHLVLRPLVWVPITATIAGIPWNAFSNGLIGFHSNTTPVQYYYESRIRDVFLSSQSVDWADVYSLLEARRSTGGRLPMLILNSTLDLGVGRSQADEHGYNTIYEHTPVRYGSDSMGYFCHANTSMGCSELYEERSQLGSLEKIASVSGAAWDSTAKMIGRSDLERMLISGLNFDLGLWFKNPIRPNRRCWQRYIPLYHLLQPSWYRKDIRGCHMLLTDGGHSENLGAYSVVRRLPKYLIIIDGENDRSVGAGGTQRFGSYQRLKALLYRDMKLTLSVPFIDEGLTRDNFVYFGEITRFRVAGEKPAHSSIGVIYIKLPSVDAVNRQCADKKLPLSVCSYAGVNPSFPQDGTFLDQFFDVAQFTAYRDLGIEIMKKCGENIKEAVARERGREGPGQGSARLSIDASSC